MVEKIVETEENACSNQETAETEVEIKKIYTIEILKIIKEVQQQHGLRHGDYQRYRGYCSRRIRRLRKTLNLPQGDKRHFRKRNVTVGHLVSKNSDDRFLLIPLMLAERAWSYAMQLRQESNTDHRKKFHLISKLRKACSYALQLQELLNSEFCDARTKLEGEAYVAWMHGSLHFELGLWKSAAENLKKAQVVYENLIQTLPEDEQTVYRAKVDELTPSLRYCSYNIGENSSLDDLLEMRSKGLIENLSTLVAQTKTESSEAYQTTEWRGRKVTVKPERVRLFFISIQDITKVVEKARTMQDKIEILENVLIDCKDAIAAIKEDNKQDPKFRAPGTDGQPLTGAQYLLNYLNYTRLMLTLERNLYLVEQGKQDGGDKKVKPQDLSRLYEIIVQNISELQQLPGMDMDTGYQAELESLAIAFKAFRCYYIALTLVNLKRWKEGVAMYERSTNYANVALKSKPTQFDLEKDLRLLVKSVEGSKYSAHAYSILEEDPSSEESALYGRGQKSSKPLFERLTQYKEDPLLNSRNPNVFKLTPDMEPIPCKPLFFDMALNYIEFPSLDDKLESPGKKGSNTQPAGVSGFVKGLFSWGGGAK